MSTFKTPNFSGIIEDIKFGQVFAWALYDFANSPYSTIMTTIAFPIFFVEMLAPSGMGDLLWGLTYGVSELFVGIFGPLLGAISDTGGKKKPFLFTFAIICVLFTALCSILKPGEITLGMALFFFANIAFASSLIFYNALLVDIAPPKRMGFVSGFGWAVGYLGGFSVIIMCLPLYKAGITETNITNIHISFLIVSAFLFVFTIPLMLFVKEKKGTDKLSIIDGYKRIVSTIKNVKKYKNIILYLFSYLLFNDGINTVILFAGIYGRVTFHYSVYDLFFLFLYLQFAGFIGSLFGGTIADSIGMKKTLIACLILWCFAVLEASIITNKVEYTILGIVAGLLLGATQGVARSFMGKLVPPGMESEFFGFFALCEKFSALIGPVLFGIVSYATKSQRLAIASILIMFIGGLLIMFRVKEEEPSML